MPDRRSSANRAPAGGVFTHTNRKGETYYLHEGETKTGKVRYYFAKTVRERPLAKMPEGFEVSESINAVVSVRRIPKGEVSVPASDLEVVRAALQSDSRLRYHQARVIGSSIVVFEPDRSEADLRGLAMDLARPLPDSYITREMQTTRYSPVMKFERHGDGYTAHRMTYRGNGGWSYPLRSGTLSKLVGECIPVLGTEEFFELM